ncbi:MAG: hypothetical protein ACR5K9_11320 [Wolbachia sp.]
MSLVKEEFEAEKEMAEIIKECDVPDAKTEWLNIENPVDSELDKLCNKCKG